jgi:lipopolysaccharide transport system ATP-binding protein
MKNTPVLQLKNVGLAYREGRLRLFNRRLFWVLKNISFTLYSGETLGVVGRNGAGKSTLLRLLAGIYREDRGTVVRYGARAALLSLNAGFSPDLTGRENAILSGILLGIRKRDIEARLDEILEFSELGDFFDEPLHTYSSGMKARLGFSVAFQVQPEIMLVDEVLGVGDENFRLKSSAAMKQRIRENGTVILVSHSVATIKELCDRAVWINDGETMIEGEVEPVLASYLEHETWLREQGASLRGMHDG